MYALYLYKQLRKCCYGFLVLLPYLKCASLTCQLLHSQDGRVRYKFFLFAPSDQLVGLRTGSGQNGPAYGSEPLSSPAPVGQSAGIWCGGKNVYASLGPFHLNWPEPVLFGSKKRTNRKRPMPRYPYTQPCMIETKGSPA